MAAMAAVSARYLCATLWISGKPSSVLPELIRVAADLAQGSVREIRKTEVSANISLQTILALKPSADMMSCAWEAYWAPPFINPLYAQLAIDQEKKRFPCFASDSSIAVF
jgi:hypothetical protein